MKNGGIKKSGGIAVVGMANIFPKALNSREFLDNILHKKNCIISVPEYRWPDRVNNFISKEYLPDKAVSGKAGLIENFHFDPHGFLVDKDLLSELDPVHQLVLHAGKDAFSQCFHTRENHNRTGVILAAIALPTDASSRVSQQIISGRGDKDSRGLTPRDFSSAGVVSLPAAILARALGLKAGCFTLDAACASSLFSIKLACEHLYLQKADIMIAGGVSRPDSLYTQIGFTQLQALSQTGTCAAFDKNADGLVVGEGVGIVILKRVEDAVQCGDKIHAVITGAGVSNDIEGTLVGPASEGQIRAMTKAYKQACWSPEEIQYMECHGSGTPVGDQVELTSIKRILDHFECPDKHLAIGSVKSMTGHLLTAAGAAGFIKTVLAMNKGVLPPSLNYSEPSSKSPIKSSNIRVQTEVEEWRPAFSDSNEKSARKAGISAFGFGGINAHILIKEYKKNGTNHFIKKPDTQGSGSVAQKRGTITPCAIVGMGTVLKNCTSLSQFKDILSGKISLIPEKPGSRWKKTDSKSVAEKEGLYINTIDCASGEFHIPPNQMDDILPQHIILLKAAKGALEDAGISPRPLEGEPQREDMGCAVGIEFDYGATDFHLRWKMDPPNEKPDGKPDENYYEKSYEKLKNDISPPLTFNRTLGALGGIVASRVAREFKLGGPCFTLSAGSASGIKAIETALHSLSSHETNLFICGSVDLACDIRQFALNNTAKDHTSDILPSEGAGAIVLKRLDQAVEAGDKIYGVITGVSGSSGAGIPGEEYPDIRTSEKLYVRSLENALKEADTSFKDIALYEKCRSGIRGDESVETTVLKTLVSKLSNPGSCRITSTSSVIGNTRGASAMFSIIKTALLLNSGQRDKRKPYKACVASISMDGAFSHVILEEKKNESSRKPVFNPNLIAQGSLATSRAHKKFLEFSRIHMQTLEHQFKTLTQLAEKGVHTTGDSAPSGVTNFQQERQSKSSAKSRLKSKRDGKAPLFRREKCLEYAAGLAGNVLGKAFEVLDTYPVRVRLPDEPLMLVDRIMDIQGEKLSLSSGEIITQHDVKEGIWYLDGNKAPVSITIEAGQADLFLCAWLGIDHVVKGSRKYRLLDAKVTFHRTLPEPFETIEYHIEIDRFLKQGDVYLFFFHYKGYIDEQLLISMKEGCAGFFTEQEIENSKGIILKQEDLEQIEIEQKFNAFVPVNKTAFSDGKVEALREGDLGKAFGDDFKDKKLGRHLRLPGKRMHLIDRILEFDPLGGRFGMGSITAEADIHGDEWFLKCHFIDDMVMPGTLMYECCAHALRVFTQRVGWVSDREDIFYDVVLENESDLKCRGPVTTRTRKVTYEIEIKEMGYDPEPYVIADAHMFSDDLRIVLYKNMGLKIVGLTKNYLISFWRET